MISSLFYLTTSRPDIIFSVCLCARFQSCPKNSHLIAIKRIIRYLKGTIRLGLWYPKIRQFLMTNYSDADYTGCRVDRKSTSEISISWKLSCSIVFPETKFHSPLNRGGGVCCGRSLLCASFLDEIYSLWLWFAFWPY